MSRTRPLLALLGVAMLSGCLFGGGPAVKARALTGPEPVWVMNPDAQGGDERYCAVGVASPTFYPDDARNQAAQDCRASLAKSTISEVFSMALDSTSRGSSQIQTTVSDAVINDARVIEYWLKANGDSCMGMTYALCCIPKGRVADAASGRAPVPKRRAPEPAAPERAEADEGGVPAWVINVATYKKPGQVCSIGVVPRTFYPEDAIEPAYGNCRRHLAETASIQVKSVMIDEAHESGDYVENVNTVVALMQDAVDASAENVEYWYDEVGLAAPCAGMTYALCCMPEALVKR